VQEEALLEAQQDIASAHARVRSEKAIAHADFTEDDEDGLANGLSFAQWLEAGKAPAYDAALVCEQHIGATLQSIESAIAGPKAAAQARDRVAINRGFSDVTAPG
jgi:hypothetical protein